MTNIASNREYMLSKNPYQGKFKKALFVCSGGILRSPTAAHWAAANKRWNTRSCGILPLAVPQINPTLVDWADTIYCLTRTHYEYLLDTWGDSIKHKLIVLNIPDNYEYRNPELIKLIEAALKDE